MEFKIIFTSLGPNKTYKLNEIEYKDGDVVEVDKETYFTLTSILYYAQTWTQPLEVKIKRLLESNDKKRLAILKKVGKL